MPGAQAQATNMKRMVRYTLMPGRAAENERLVAAVFEALHRERPPGLRYATFRLEDGLSFVHLVSYESGPGDAGDNPLIALPAFEAFVAGARDRCATPPVSVELTEIGSYGFFGG